MLRLTSPAAKFPARSKRKVETRPGADDLGQYPCCPSGKKRSEAEEGILLA